MYSKQHYCMVTLDLWVGLQVGYHGDELSACQSPYWDTDRQQHSVDHHGETKLWGKRTATHKMRVAEAVESLQNRRKTADQGDTGPTYSKQ